MVTKMGRRNHIPDIDFDRFLIGTLKDIFKKDKIYINPDYQRGDIWKPSQRIELIKSISNQYSIGVLVLFINDEGKFEVLDGQQRLLTIKKYLFDELPLKSTGLKRYSELDDDDKIHLDAYSVCYLKLKSHNPETKEEDIVQTFLRLQEGTPLNTAEKINAYRGEFKNTFRDKSIDHSLFKKMGKDKRFRLRYLCAQLLHLELESDFKNLIFPALDLDSLRTSCEKYQLEISQKKKRFFSGNLDFLDRSLGHLISGIKVRDLIPFYLLISYLRREKANNKDLETELAIFCTSFLKNIYSFSPYDIEPPKNSGMSKGEFLRYLKYKQEARKATSADSVKYRFDFIKEKFEKDKPFIIKDKKRFHDEEQKRTLFFQQEGICPECGKLINFHVDASAHHVIAHQHGGKTNDLEKAVLLHTRCHQKLEKRLLEE